MRTIRLRWITYALFAIFSPSASADWHAGRIKDLYIGYDGQTTSITLIGFTKTNCTCYPVWLDRMCLDRTRATYREELAVLLLAKSTGQTISLNINEETCKIVAVGID